jgi:outer membrane beta-barrel protein
MTRTTRLTRSLAVALALGLCPLATARAQEAGAAEGAAAESDETSAEARDTEEGAEREDPRGRIADRVKSVQRKVFVKKKRLELFPQFGLDLNDPFFQHLVAGAALGYHFADSFSMELRGGAVIATLDQSSIRFVRQESGSLLKNPPRFKYHADADLLWAPFYGKLSVLGEGILHFDTYLTTGAGVFGTDSGANPAVNIGIGQRYFISDWLVARVELRDYVFMENRNGESDLQNLLILGFSLSGFFPTSFSYDFQ